MADRVQCIRVLITLGVLVGALNLPVAGQSPRGQLVPLYPTPVSRRVVAAYAGERVDAGLERLHLLVLWRGEPGWFNSASFGGRGGGDAPGVYDWYLKVGSTDTRIYLDVARGIADVRGYRVELERANVLFIDSVDAKGPGEVIGTARVDAYLAAGARSGAERLIPVLNVPEIRKFLDCSAPGSAFIRGRNLCPSLTP